MERIDMLVSVSSRHLVMKQGLKSYVSGFLTLIEGVLFLCETGLLNRFFVLFTWISASYLQLIGWYIWEINLLIEKAFILVNMTKEMNWNIFQFCIIVSRPKLKYCSGIPALFAFILHHEEKSFQTDLKKGRKEKSTLMITNIKLKQQTSFNKKSNSTRNQRSVFDFLPVVFDHCWGSHPEFGPQDTLALVWRGEWQRQVNGSA